MKATEIYKYNGFFYHIFKFDERAYFIFNKLCIKFITNTPNFTNSLAAFRLSRSMN